MDRVLLGFNHKERFGVWVGDIGVGRNPEAGQDQIDIPRVFLVGACRIDNIEKAVAGGGGVAITGVESDIEHAVLTTGGDDPRTDVQENGDAAVGMEDFYDAGLFRDEQPLVPGMGDFGDVVKAFSNGVNPLTRVIDGK